MLIAAEMSWPPPHQSGRRGAGEKGLPGPGRGLFGLGLSAGGAVAVQDYMEDDRYVMCAAVYVPEGHGGRDR